MYIMVLAAEKTNIRSFEGMARWLFPKGHYAFSYWAAFVRLFFGLSACIAYVISVGNIISPIFKEAHRRNPDSVGIGFFNKAGGNRILTILVWLCGMLPLMIPKHIDSLRYASTFAVSFLVYFALVVFAHSCTHGLKDFQNYVKTTDRNEDANSDERIIYLFRTGNTLLSSIGVFIFSYLCHVAVYEIWWDMRPEVRTPRNFVLLLSLGLAISAIIYIITAFFGYVDFGSTIGSNSILLMYNPINEPQVMIAYIGILVKLCVSYAILGTTARNSIYYLIGWQKRFANKASVPPEHSQTAALKNSTAHHTQDEENKHIPTGEISPINTEEDTTYVDNIPYLWHVIVVLILSFVTLLCGLFIPKINTVFGFAGSVTGGFLGFIFPALFYMYSGGFSVEREGRFNYYSTYIIMFIGVFAIVFGFGITVYDSL
ncbi:unnamed protein product [Phytomonas sp. Hart1]|nr:unnamed protein product [Phytomonas sp. Hart1]|eukprot:CCW71573.1 unnamed protein product [Phytomonas sp. isolate Hart1]